MYLEAAAAAAWCHIRHWRQRSESCHQHWHGNPWTGKAPGKVPRQHGWMLDGCENLLVINHIKRTETYCDANYSYSKLLRSSQSLAYLQQDTNSVYTVQMNVKWTLKNQKSLIAYLSINNYEMQFNKCYFSVTVTEHLTEFEITFSSFKKQWRHTYYVFHSHYHNY